jgi:hypothetical protein
MTAVEAIRRKYQSAKLAGLVVTLNDLQFIIRCEMRKQKIRNIFGIGRTND